MAERAVPAVVVSNVTPKTIAHIAEQPAIFAGIDRGRGTTMYGKWGRRQRRHVKEKHCRIVRRLWAGMGDDGDEDTENEDEEANVGKEGKGEGVRGCRPRIDEGEGDGMDDEAEEVGIEKEKTLGAPRVGTDDDGVDKDNGLGADQILN